MGADSGPAMMAWGLVIIGCVGSWAGCGATAAAADLAAEAVEFTSDRWTLRGGRVVEHLGRTCLSGSAVLADVELADGIIEVDLALTWERSYPGIDFRIRPGQNSEQFYVRPHRGKFYLDALQYTPVFNGIACWQLYSGDGFTAGFEFPWDEWIPLRLEFSGQQARVFVGDGAEPALRIPDLKHPAAPGAIGLSGPADGSCYFSNFRYRRGDELAFPPPAEIDPAPGLIRDWQLSAAIPLPAIDLSRPPGEQDLGEVVWEEVPAEPGGLVTVARWRGRTGPAPDCVIARTTLRSAAARVMPLSFGYSDLVSIFLNGERVFTGSSAYRQRDPSFLGIVGLFDEVPLRLRAGENELVLVVAEAFGGWGFICQDAEARFAVAGVVQCAESPAEFLTPESVLHDPQRGLCYVSNFDAYRSAGVRGQFISQVALSGDVLVRQWVTGLDRPTGMALGDGQLLVVERSTVAAVDLSSGAIVARYPIPGAQFPNDIAVDAQGVAYISDSAGGKIYRLAEGEVREWSTGAEIANPNALYLDGDRLLVGNNGDHSLKAIALTDGAISTMARLPRGTIDGIRRDGAGDYLVSHWEGRLYRVAPDGSYRKLLDTTAPGVNAADFEYLVEDDLLVVPTFMRDRVVMYHLGDS